MSCCRTEEIFAAPSTAFQCCQLVSHRDSVQWPDHEVLLQGLLRARVSSAAKGGKQWKLKIEWWGREWRPLSARACYLVLRSSCLPLCTAWLCLEKTNWSKERNGRRKVQALITKSKHTAKERKSREPMVKSNSLCTGSHSVCWYWSKSCTNPFRCAHDERKSQLKGKPRNTVIN